MTARHILRIMWIVAVGLLLVAVPGNPYTIDPSQGLLPPSPGHLAGTDRLGRDVLSRTSCGLRHTLKNVLVAECLGASGAFVFAAGALGLGLGRRGGVGTIDFLTLSLRMVPPLLVALTLGVLLRGTAHAVVVPLAVLSFAFAAPVFEGELKGVLHLPQLQGATALGASWTWQVRKYVLPVLGPRLARYIVLDAMALAAYESLFGFFGLGDPSQPSLGGMLAEARFYLGACPWLFLAPAAALVVLLSGAWQVSVATVEWR